MTGAPAAPAAGLRRLPLLLGLAALALLPRALGLSSQPLIGDDLLVGETARNFVGLGLPDPTMWNHPRLRDLLVWLSLEAFGDGPWGLKAWSVALGTLSVPAVAALVLRLGGGPLAAGLAGLVVATDPLHLDFSRQGINDVYLSLFSVAALLALFRYREGRRPAWLAAAGLLLGLGISSKWSAVTPVAAAAAVVLVEALRSNVPARERAAEILLLLAALALLPLAVYVLTYWPWFGQGRDLSDWLGFQAAMARETATHTGYGTKLPSFPGEVVGAWRWFLQPSWYVDYIRATPDRPEIPAAGVFLSGVANPLTWLPVLPAAAWAAVRALRQRDVTAAWLLLLFLSAWLPFVLVPRPIWTNSSLQVLPFAAALVGWAAARLHRLRPLPVRGWAVAALLLAALLWPPVAGLAPGPSQTALRALVEAAAFDPANH